MRRAPSPLASPPSEIRVAAAAESVRAIGLARRLGKRLRHQLNLLDKGKLPDGDWRETWRDYTRAIGELGRLAVADEIGGAYRERPAGMSDQEYAEELEAIAIGVLRRATAEQREELIAAADAPEPRSKHTDSTTGDFS